MEKLLHNWFSKKELDRAWSLLLQAQKITFLTHYNPDADGVSACAALAHIVEKYGKSVEVVYPSKLQFPLKREVKNIFINEHNQFPDLLVIFDTATYDRLYYPEEFKSIPAINIDHHLKNNINVGGVNIVTDQVSSTCELLYLLLIEWAADDIDQYVVECLLLGILYDTQVFHTQSTTSQTLKVSADLMMRGANLYELSAELLHTKNPEVIHLWGQFLSNVTIDKDKGVAWVAITQDMLKQYNAGLASLVGFSNFLAQLSNIDISILLYETLEGRTKVSLRSKISDVNAIAGKFGGGGHKHASGIMTETPIKHFTQELINAL